MTIQDKARQDQTRQGKSRQDKTKQDKTKQSKTRQIKTRQHKARQDKARQHKAWQDETRQDENKARQRNARQIGQGKARQHKTQEQDTKTRHDNKMHHQQGTNRNCQLFFARSIFLILHSDTNTCTFRLLYHWYKGQKPKNLGRRRKNLPFMLLFVLRLFLKLLTRFKLNRSSLKDVAVKVL